MSFYDEFNKNIGKCVKILCHDGHVYHGYIDQVDEHHVYLRPLGNKMNEAKDNENYFFLGAALIAVPFTLIADVSYNPFFYW